MADDVADATPAPDEAASDAAPEAAPEPERLFGALVTDSCGQAVLHPSRDELVDLVRTLRDDEGYNMCVDLTGVDYLTFEADRNLPPGVEPERFEVVVSLLSHASRARLRLRVQVPEAEPVCPSLFDVHPGTEALEREVYDLVGIAFDGHPDLTRIQMPEDWEGHPLRKDYGVGRIPVQFKAAPSAR